MIMKTKNRNFLISVVLMGIATMMTACVDNDLASQTPIGDKIVGKWYAETPKQVTIGTGAKADAEKEAEIRKKLKELIANVNSGDAGIGYGGPGNGSAHARRLGDI